MYNYLQFATCRAITASGSFGIGDVVAPAPVWIEYLSLLDMPRPRLRIYTPESVVAEKLHAMVALGLRNSRLRDFFDVDALARRTEFDGEILASAIGATFARCQTEIPASAPTALTAAFYGSPEKQAQWRAFRNKVSGSDEGDSRQEVVERLALFLTLPLDACRAQGKFAAQWPAGGPWTL